MASEKSGIIDLLVGAAAVVAGALTAGVGSAAVAAISHFLVTAGAGLVLSGLGTLISGAHDPGFSSTIRNPIQPRRVHVGVGRTGGALVYMSYWGGNDVMLDMVIVLATHSCQGGDLSYQLNSSSLTYNMALGKNLIPELLFNQKRIQIDRTKAPALASQTGGSSFSPAQQRGNTQVLIYSAVRVGSIITFILKNDIPYLSPGDQIQIDSLPTGISQTGNGIWYVSQIIGRGGGYYGITFTVLSGGPAFADVSYTVGVGHASTLWADYGSKVYIEVMTGKQTLGQTFVANYTGTPLDGDGGNYVSPSNPAGLSGTILGLFQLGGQTSQSDQWTSFCSLQGMTAVFLRMHYDQTIFTAGIPQISFLLYGKDDVYDPRLGAYGTAGTRVYTTNPACCIADYLAAGGPLSATWLPAFSYSAGAVASYVSGQGGVGVDYVSAISSNAGNEPDTHVADWFPVTPATAPTGWDATIPYALGRLVQYPGLAGDATIGGIQYISTVNSNTGHNPSTYPSYWAPLPVPVHPLLKYGYSLGYGTDIPISQLTLAANTCDLPVALLEGGTEPMYSCNGQFDLDMRRGEVLQNLLTSCAGRMTTVEGQYVIQPGYYFGPGSPALQLTLAPICAGPPKWKPFPTIRELYNGVKGTYISPANKWQSSDFPAYAQDYLHGYAGPAQYDGDVNVAIDGGDRRWLDIHLPFTISSSMAQRIAKIELLRRRHFGIATFILNLSGYQLVPLDIFEATFPFLSWVNELVEVQSVRFVTTKQNIDGMDVPTLSIEIDVQTVDPSIYTWNVDEELTPTGYQTANPPIATVVETVPLPWSPGYNAPMAGDATYPTGALGPASFGVTPNYVGDSNGNLVPSLQITGYLPFNFLDTGLYGPLITATSSSIGGNLSAGSYIVGLSAYDAGSSPYKNVEYLDFALVTIPATSPPTYTNLISVEITWFAGDFEGDLYIALQSISPALGQQLKSVNAYDSRAVMHWNQNISSTSISSATITALDQSQPGGPDSQFDHFGVVWSPIVHAGVWAEQVQHVTGTSGSSPGTITIADLTASSNPTLVNQYAGCTVSLLGRYVAGVAVPILNMPVLSNTASVGNQFVLTIGPNSASVSLPSLTTLLTVGDLVVMRTNATFTASSFTDPNIANTYYPTGATGIEAGHLAYVLTGPDAGDVKTISGVTPVGGLDIRINIVGTWNLTPNPGDRVIVVSPNQSTEWKSPPFVSPNKLTPTVSIVPNVQNLADQTWLFQVRTKNSSDHACPDFMAPFSEVYFFGAQGTRTVSANTTQVFTDGTIRCITSGVTQPTPIALSVAMLSTDTTAQVSNGLNVVNGTNITIDTGGNTETVLVESGGAVSGPVTLTVIRGQLGTTPVAHAMSVGIVLPGGLTVSLLAQSAQPQQGLWITKISTDINYVMYTCAAGDALPSVPAGRTSGILPDGSTNSSVFLQASGVGN
jgi:hypothetical protein